MQKNPNPQQMQFEIDYENVITLAEGDTFCEYPNDRINDETLVQFMLRTFPDFEKRKEAWFALTYGKLVEKYALVGYLLRNDWGYNVEITLKKYEHNNTWKSEQFGFVNERGKTFINNYVDRFYNEVWATYRNHLIPVIDVVIESRVDECYLRSILLSLDISAKLLMQDNSKPSEDDYFDTWLDKNYSQISSFFISELQRLGILDEYGRFGELFIALGYGDNVPVEMGLAQKEEPFCDHAIVLTAEGKYCLHKLVKNYIHY